MTHAENEVRELDRSLNVDGQDVVLRRIIGTTHQVNIDVTCRAFVRQYRPQELTGMLSQGDSHVIMSPTQIINEQWPGGEPVIASDALLDRRVPKDGDKMVIAGKIRAILAVAPIYIANDLVRLELQVRG